MACARTRPPAWTWTGCRWACPATTRSPWRRAPPWSGWARPSSAHAPCRTATTGPPAQPGLLDLLLAQLARQRAPMHAQPARGLGHVEPGFGQYFVDALPFQGLDRGRALAQADL